MIRSFALADIPLVSRLQANEMPLAVEHVLTHPRQPLWLALTAPWPWAVRGVATYVLRERSQGKPLAGFVQLLKRATRPEADLLHLAPLPGLKADADDAFEAIWRRLLMHCSREAARRGLQRIFASVPEGGPEFACLRETGFSFYTRETIYRLAEGPCLSEQATAGFRRQQPSDGWALQRLYARSTPCLVQQAEGAMTGDAGTPPLSWWEPGRWRGIVWAPAGEVRGAAQVHMGRAGHWLRVWGASQLTARETRSLVEEGLRVLSAAKGRRNSGSLPVYATVREYEAGLSGALTGFGFAPYTDRARLVRHTVAVRPIQVTASVPDRAVRRQVPVRSQAQTPQDAKAEVS